MLAGLAVLGGLVVLLALMYFGWRRRQQRQSGLPRPHPVPPGTGVPVIAQRGFYVASTIADEPLNRIAVAGLGYRARASIAVVDGGVVLGITGEPDAFLPAADIVAVGRSTWTIDRVVETGGLVRITWRLGGTVLDSFLRVAEPDDPTELIDAIQTIIETPTSVRNEEK